MPKSSLPTLCPETLIDERYRLVERLGRGGFGEVWKALEQSSGLVVAIKLFTQTPEQNPLWYWNELAVLRAHRLRWIVTLLDEGFWHGMPYLVMEFVEGKPFPGTAKENVYEIIERTGKLLDLLSIVHAEGILHNDIKPANVLVNDEGQPILLDFGTAADPHINLQVDQESLPLSLMYTAPERFDKQPPTPGSDLYSIGVMLFEALTGTLPFKQNPNAKDSTQDLIDKCCFQPAPKIETLVPSLPDHIRRIVNGLLQKNPKQRHISAADLAEALRKQEPERINLAQWFATHGIAVDSKTTVSPAHLVPLFTGMERLFHEPSRAAAELHRRTKGKPRKVNEEVGILLLSGAWFEGDRLKVGKLLLQSDQTPKARNKQEKQTPTQHLARAYQWIRKGPLDRALQELMHAVSKLRNLEQDSTESVSTYEKLLSAWMDIALAEGTKRVLGPLQFEINRAPATPLIQRLDQLASAVAAITVGGTKALSILDTLAPFEDIRLELRRQSVRATACRRLGPEMANLTEETFNELDQWIIKHKTTKIAWTRYQSWRGWYYYHHGQFSLSAHAHLASSSLDNWPIAKASSLISAASALMETTEDAYQAVLIAQQALQQIQACESPFMEARAEWTLRTARYRNAENLTPDQELIDAVQRLVGTPDIEAQVYLTEAAIAFRNQNHRQAADLAERAANLWKGTRSPRNHDLASAFAWAMGGRQVPSEEIPVMIDRAMQDRTPTIALQTLAFLRQATPGLNLVSRAAAISLCDKINVQQWNRRQDILSCSECLARFT